MILAYKISILSSNLGRYTLVVTYKSRLSGMLDASEEGTWQ